MEIENKTANKREEIFERSRNNEETKLEIRNYISNYAIPLVLFFFVVINRVIKVVRKKEKEKNDWYLKFKSKQKNGNTLYL